MLNRVNTYLQRIPLIGPWFGRISEQLNPNGLCILKISPQEADLLYTDHPLEKLDITYFKSFSYTSIAELTTQLSKEVKNNNLENIACSWMLDPQQYQLILLEDLPVEPAEFQSAIRWKIKSLLSFPVEDAVIDSFPMPVQKTFRPQKMIMVVVARASYLQSVIQPLQKSGLNINMIDIPELGLKNISAMLESADRCNALIYAHGNVITLVITYQKQLYLSRRIDFEFDSSNLGSDENNKSIEKLALEIQRSFDYFQSQWRISEPSNIYFASSKSQAIIASIIEKLSMYLVTTIITLNLDSIITNTAHLSAENQGKYLPLIGGLFKEEIKKYVTTD